MECSSSFWCPAQPLQTTVSSLQAAHRFFGKVQKLKVRAAWVEEDVVLAQIEIAERTLVLRYVQDWMTVADRELTVQNAFEEAGLQHVNGTSCEWDLITIQMDDDQGKNGSHRFQSCMCPPFECART